MNFLKESKFLVKQIVTGIHDRRKTQADGINEAVVLKDILEYAGCDAVGEILKNICKKVETEFHDILNDEFFEDADEHRCRCQI